MGACGVCTRNRLLTLERVRSTRDRIDLALLVGIGGGGVVVVGDGIGVARIQRRGIERGLLRRRQPENQLELLLPAALFLPAGGFVAVVVTVAVIVGVRVGVRVFFFFFFVFVFSALLFTISSTSSSIFKIQNQIPFFLFSLFLTLPYK